MNKIILMIGSIMLLYSLILVVLPCYTNYVKIRSKEKTRIDENNYKIIINVISIFTSIMINFLIWGWFL